MNSPGRFIGYCLALISFLAPLKFGMPVIFQSAQVSPLGWWEWFCYPWPYALALMFVFAMIIPLVLDANRLLVSVDALFLLPLVFLVTQFGAMFGSINLQVSTDTALHFTVCVVLFYLAAWYVRDGAGIYSILGGLSCATCIICILALEQFFGGLQATREFAAVYGDPSTFSATWQARLASNRVFSTLVYPNTLAGFIVLAFPSTLAWIWVWARNWNARIRWVALGLAAILMLSALALTGSRGGFVAFAATVAVAVWSMGNSRRQWLWGTLVGLGVLGVLFVTGVTSGVTKSSARSLEARFDYWNGSIEIARENLWLGTGPGTFGSIYPMYKIADTEEAQLVHNNFLQIASDSGLIAFLIFSVLWLVAARDMLRLLHERRKDMAAIAICAGLTGWIVHSFVDFDLYVPGIAIPAFLLLGCLQGLKKFRWGQAVPQRGLIGWVRVGICVVIVGLLVWKEIHILSASFSYAQSVALELKGGDENLKKAMLELNRVVELSPNDSFYQNQAGDLALRLGLIDQTIYHYDKAILEDPYRASNYRKMAHAYQELASQDVTADLTHLRTSLAYLRQAVALNPTQAEYRMSRIELEESVRQLERSLLESEPAWNGAQ